MEKVFLLNKSNTARRGRTYAFGERVPPFGLTASPPHPHQPENITTTCRGGYYPPESLTSNICFTGYKTPPPRRGDACVLARSYTVEPFDDGLWWKGCKKYNNPSVSVADSSPYTVEPFDDGRQCLLLEEKVSAIADG